MTVTTLLTWLLTYAAHSTILLAAAWVAVRWIRAAAVRDLVWKVAVAGSLLTATLQTVGLGEGVKTISLMAPAPVPPPVLAEPAPGGPLEDQVSAKFATRTPNPEESAGSTTQEPSAWQRWDWASGLVSLWAAVAALLTMWLGVRRWQLARWLGRRRVLLHHPARTELTHLCRTGGVHRAVTLTVSDRLASPIAVGWAEVALPAKALVELEPEQRRSMLAHELAHLARLDPAWLAAVTLLERVFFFQPLLRHTRQAMQVEAELLCDERAAQWTGSGMPLAKCLVKVAEWIDSAPRPLPVAGLAEEGSQLIERVRHLVEEKPTMSRKHVRLALTAVVAVAGGAAFLIPKVTLVGQNAQPAARAKMPRGLLPQAAIANGPISLGPLGPALAKAPGRSSVQDTGSAVVAALVEALKDESPEVRVAAAQSLGALGSRRATAGLVAALGDQHSDLRVAAAQALGQLEDPNAVAALAGKLSDGETEVRRAALQALSQIRRGVTVDMVRPALDDRDPEIREAAVQAVGELKDKGSEAVLTRLVADANPDVRRAALQALSNLELETLPAGVLDALRDNKADVRQAAAWLVGSVGDRRAVPSLKTLLGDSNAEVREAAVHALGSIRDATAIDALVTGLKSADPVVRRAAAEALGQREER